MVFAAFYKSFARQSQLHLRTHTLFQNTVVLQMRNLWVFAILRWRSCVGCFLGSDGRPRGRYHAVCVGKRLPSSVLWWRNSRHATTSHQGRSLSALRHTAVLSSGHRYCRRQLTYWTDRRQTRKSHTRLVTVLYCLCVTELIHWLALMQFGGLWKINCALSSRPICRSISANS